MEKINLFNELFLSEFLVNLEFDKESPILSSDFPSFAIRGSIMYKAKKLLCVNKTHFNNCNECMLSRKCIYATLFETQRPHDAAIMRKYRNIPHPFVISVYPFSRVTTLRIVLFGEYINLFPYFYLVLKSLEKEKKFNIKSIKNFDRPILKSNKLMTNFKVRSSEEFENLTPEKTEFLISILTPIRMKYNGKLVNQTNMRFHHIIRNLLRRFSLLFYFYGSGPWNIDFSNFIKLAEDIEFKSAKLKWVELERYSIRTKTFEPMGGVVGEIELPEKAIEFFPILKLGEYTQVGKNTSFGLGFYKLNF